MDIFNMKSIYETKSYKLILSYSTNTILHKNNTFSKTMTFNVLNFNGRTTDYFVTIMLDYNKINNTIKTLYIFQNNISLERREVAEKLKYDAIFIANIYSNLFDDINNSNYIVSNR